jgi:hypothetical protein
MPCVPCPPSRLDEPAQSLRRNADETKLADCIRMMVRAAEDLEQMADKLRRSAECEAVSRARRYP